MVDHFITWAQWSFMRWAIVALVGVLFLVAYALRAYRSVSLLAATRHRTRLMQGFSLTRLWLQISLTGTCLLLLVITLMRPQYRDHSLHSSPELARDVVIAVDISRSMLVEDETGNVSRILRAHQLIDKIVEHIQLERIALVAFSGNALTLCPLTRDISALRMFLDILSPEIISGSGTTSLEAAINEALKLFAGHTSSPAHKLLVIFTDGEDFSPHLGKAQQKAREAGFNISIIGLGTTQGGPVPTYNDKGERVGYQKDTQGSVVISRLNEALLKQIAYDCKGLYIPQTVSNEQAMSTLMGWVRAQEAHHVANYQDTGKIDLFMWTLVVAVILVAMVWI